MAKTYTFSVSTADTPVIAQTATKEITIMEDASVASWPTTNFNLKIPKSTDPAIQRAAGTPWTFVAHNAFFAAGQIVGYVSTVTGTTTFQQYESGF